MNKLSRFIFWFFQTVAEWAWIIVICVLITIFYPLIRSAIADDDSED